MTQNKIKFEEIYNQTNEQVLAHTLRVIKHLQDSEDVTMEVFKKITKLMENPLTTFDSEKSSLSTYVHMVTNSVILDYFRKNKNNKYKFVSDYVDNEGNEFFEFESSTKSNSDTDILNKELKDKIDNAFKTLKPDYLKIAILYFNYQYTYTEIAKILNVPMGTVKAMLSRCREKLQTELKDLKTAVII